MPINARVLTLFRFMTSPDSQDHWHRCAMTLLLLQQYHFARNRRAIQMNRHGWKFILISTYHALRPLGKKHEEYAKRSGIDAAGCEPLTRPRVAEKNPHFVRTGSL